LTLDGSHSDRPLIDLTQPLDGHVPVYPGDSPFSSQQPCTIGKDGYSFGYCTPFSFMCTGIACWHTYNVDAPSHFIADGATIHQLPPSALIQLVDKVVFCNYTVVFAKLLITLHAIFVSCLSINTRCPRISYFYHTSTRKPRLAVPCAMAEPAPLSCSREFCLLTT